ncbi:MAG: hypothetical protein HGJ94_06855 [Desulfosarcina sp.]|nr:hypothetical protein [Desulfosarcina sp.]MBC2744673.1 hypothetical protein [Desulfosarcina sp.]MBC2767582.1 hypothetical protein [Desulfosarcina sp.]
MGEDITIKNLRQSMFFVKCCKAEIHGVHPLLLTLACGIIAQFETRLAMIAIPFFHIRASEKIKSTILLVFLPVFCVASMATYNQV